MTPSLRIGFDVSPLPLSGEGSAKGSLGRSRKGPGATSRGVARACDGLVRTLEERGVLEVVRLAPAAGEPIRGWRQSALPRLVRELGLAGIHSPVSAFALRGPGARVHTVHEVPWRHGVREHADLRHRFWARVAPLRSDAVLCPSEVTARDVRRGPVRAARVHVCPWGVGPPFEEEPPPGVVDEVVLGRYHLGADPIALCPGAVRPKKDLAAVLAGLAEYKRRGGRRVQLAVTGDDTLQLRRDLGLASRLGLAGWVSTPGTIEEQHLPGVLRLATVVPVLSRSEGFAFPVLEAMASGTPVLVPRGSAQAELAGAAGIEVEPGDAASVAAGFERALAERELLREPLVERAAHFTWTRCAEQVEALWTELA